MADRDALPLPLEVRARLAELELELSEGKSHAIVLFFIILIQNNEGGVEREERPPLSRCGGRWICAGFAPWLRTLCAAALHRHVALRVGRKSGLTVLFSVSTRLHFFVVFIRTASPRPSVSNPHTGFYSKHTPEFTNTNTIPRIKMLWINNH